MIGIFNLNYREFFIELVEIFCANLQSINSPTTPGSPFLIVLGVIHF